MDKRSKMSTRDLIEYVSSKAEYMLPTGYNILQLPVYVPIGTELVVYLEQVFSKYCELLKVEKITNEEVLKEVKDICDKILIIYKCYNNGNIGKAYKIMEELYISIKEYIPTEQIDENTKFYRMRDKKGIKDKSEFFHIPFNKRHLISNQRFSISGIPSLYLGYSKIVCLAEKKETGSMIELMLKQKISVLDLTYRKNTEGYSNPNFLKIYPIIQSCYIINGYCLNQKKECINFKPTFHEDYTFPQLFSIVSKNMSEKNGLKISGIRYYTVRDESLNPETTEYMNLILFVDHTDGEIYDNNLIDLFDWGTPYDI